jgi:hypothetical protein
VLRGYVIDYLTAKISSRKDAIVIYYFFDFSMKKSLQLSTFLRCILHQAVTPESLRPHTQRRLESLFLTPVALTKPSVEVLEELFIEAIKEFKITYLLIDGIDEVGTSDQRLLKSFFKRLQCCENVQICLAAHAAMDVSTVLRNSQTIYIQPHDLESDIEVFVQKQIDEHSEEELSICSPTLLDKIKHAIISRAGGMYVRHETPIVSVMRSR